MTSSHGRRARQLTRRYLIGLGSIALLVLLTQWTMMHQVSRFIGNAHRINLAGRQRMLSQRMAKTALAIEHAGSEAERARGITALQVDAAELERVHRGLYDGDTTLNLIGISDAATRGMLVATEPSLRALIAAARALATTTDPGSYRGHVVELQTAEVGFLEGMNRVVFQLDTEAHEHVWRTYLYTTLFAALLLALLTVEAVFVFQPAARNIQEIIAGLIESQQAREASEARARTILDTAADGIITINQDGNIEAFNGAAARIFGHRVEGVLGAHVSVLIPEHLREAHRRGFARLMAGGTPHIVGAREVELPGLRADGTLFPMELSLSEVPCEGAGRMFTGIVRDITERKETADALRRSEQQLAAAQRAAQMGHYEWDLAQDRFSGSVEAMRITGLGPAGPWVPMAQFLTLVPPEDRPAIRDRLTAIAQGSPKAEFECRMTGPDGSVRVMSLTAELAVDEHGTPQCVWGTLQDITDRKQVESELLQAQKMQAVGTLAGGIAHDFNNLLTGILGGVELATMALPEDSPALPNLESARAGAERAARLTKQLLTLSRRQDSIFEPMDLNVAVDATVRLLRRSIPESITVEAEPAERLSAIQGDPGKVEQALLNLGINARDAMPTGGLLTFGVSTRRIEPDEAARSPQARPGDFVCVAVSDTGTGMTPETMERIFEPFYTTKEQGKGTGLGLAMVYACMEEHEGWVTVTSEMHAGTTFRLYFPLRPVQDDRPEAPAPGPVTGGTETVLLVDDAAGVLDVGRKILERLGYTVLTAPNGEAAIEVYRQHARDIGVVVTDLVMPRASGRDLLRCLRGMGVTVPVIATTGYDSEAAPGLDDAAAFVTIVMKPFRMSELARAVRDALDLVHLPT